MVTETTVWPDELFADLDRTGPVPLYYQVSRRLEAAIGSGRLAAGARLENEIAIAHRLGLSRPTVRRAIAELVDKGMLVRRRGIGTQVVQGQVSRPVELTSLYEDLARSHRTPGTAVLTSTVGAAGANVADKLGLDPGSDVWHLRRQRTTDGVPVAVLTNYLPVEFADLSREQLHGQGLYQLLRERGVTIKVAQQRIGARSAREDEAELLDLDAGAAVLTMERVAFDATGRAIEFGHHCYRPDMYTFITTLVAR